MSGLEGKRVALLEARLGGELARLVERHGATTFNAPALREETIDAGPEVDALINKLAAGEIQFVVLQTGVGVMTLLNEAEKLGRKDELIAALRQTTTVCRGPKPTAVLARNKIQISVNAQEPYTTAELIAALEPLALEGAGVALLHYGERNAALTDALHGRGAKLTELCLYEWRLPESVAPLETLVAEIINRQVDAVAFTSQIQARHLFHIAAESGRAEELRDALNHKTVVASVGPTCTAALRALGVEPHVEPEHPKMAPMVQALLKHFEQH
jgi:uroporphyrinogen-III synthase